MDVVVELNESMDTVTVSVHLLDDGSFRIRCSPDVDVETLLLLNRDAAQQVIDALTNRS